MSKIRRSRRLYTKSHRYSTTEDYTIKMGVRTEPLRKQRLTGRVSQKIGRKRNTPQMKGKGEVLETMLNEIEASQLSVIEFKAMVIR